MYFKRVIEYLLKIEFLQGFFDINGIVDLQVELLYEQIQEPHYIYFAPITPVPGYSEPPLHLEKDRQHP